MKKFFPKKIVPGNIVDQNGSIIGQHQGIAFYTIGQKLLGKEFKSRLFIAQIIAEGNLLVAAEKSHLYQNRLEINQCSFYLPDRFMEGGIINTRSRGKEQEREAVIEKIQNNSIFLKLSTPVFAVAEGQSVVFYLDDCVVGGGMPVNKTNGYW